MKSDLRCLIEDLSTYLEGLRERTGLRVGRQDTDYGAEGYAQQARAAVEGIHPRSMRLRVRALIEETTSTRTFRFDRIDGPLPPFRPGQFVSLAVQIADVRTTRAYSISSAPGVGHLDLTVRRNPAGFVSPWLFEHGAEGWEVNASGPAGSFVHEPLIDRGELVMLAGGSGITPFMSMLRDAERRGWEHDASLIYGCRTPDDVIFGRELSALAAKQARFRYRLVISRPPLGYAGPSGHVDAEHVRATVRGLTGATFLVCGPGSMYEHCCAELSCLGVSAHKIRHERYGRAQHVTRLVGWPAEVRPSDRVTVEVAGHGHFTVSVAEPLLNSLERQGVPCASSCRNGECADCRVRVLSGRTFAMPSDGVRESDRADGYVHACVTYPLEDLRVEL